MKVLAVKEVSSTQEEALRLAEMGEGHLTTVVADVQTGGRGRDGKRWESPKGGLWLSTVVKAHMGDGKDQGLLPLIAALSATEALKELAGIDCRIEWPNDLVASGRKLGGVLADAVYEGSIFQYAVVGMGLNVNNPTTSLSRQVRRRSISIKELTGKESDLVQLAETILKRLELNLMLLESDSAAVVSRIERAATFVGRRVRARSGSQEILGTARGVSTDGGLIVDAENSERKILYSGHGVEVDYL